MARYGDLDALEKKLFPIGMVDDGRYALPAKSVKVAIDSIPTADVASKSEVAREIFSEIDKMLANFISLFHRNISKATIEQNKDEQEVNSIALSVINATRNCLAELKKKYIGEQNKLNESYTEILKLDKMLTDAIQQQYSSKELIKELMEYGR